MNTRVLSIGSALLAATAGLAISAPKAEALAFDLRFDNNFDGAVESPFVGTGTFSFDGNLADGTYTLDKLPNFNFLINFGTDTFDNSNLVSELDEAFVTFSNFGQQASFGDSSLDFLLFFNEDNSSEVALGLLEANAYFTLNSAFEDSLSGDYSATAVPTPALLPGLIGMGIGVLRKRRAEQEVKQEV